LYVDSRLFSKVFGMIILKGLLPRTFYFS